MTTLLTKRVAGKGYLPAKRVRDLRRGDVIVRPYLPFMRVADIRLGDYNAFLRLESVDGPAHIGIWKRLNTLVAISEETK